MTSKEIKEMDAVFQKHLIDECRKQKTPLASAQGNWIPDQNKYDINLSTIDTMLIQNIGRFVESYASDYLITRNSIDEILAERNFENCVVLFSLRKSGVDSNGFTIERIRSRNPVDIYRKVYGLYLVTDSVTVKASLHDMLPSIEYFHAKI